MSKTLVSTVVLVLVMTASAIAGNWNVPVSFKGLTNPAGRTAAAVDAGRRIFLDRCARCHGPMGAGDGEDGARAPYDLRTIMAGLTEGELFWKVTHGVGKMPSFAGILTERERWLVVTYMGTFSERPQAERR